jgi:hypothetical protein
MKAFLLTMILTLGFAVHAERESSGDVAIYLCDDGIADAGYKIRIVDLSQLRQKVEVLQKTDEATKLLVTDTLTLQSSAGKFKTYSNGVADLLLEMTISLPDRQNQKSVVVTYESKRLSVRIPEQGSMICARE